MKNDIVIYILYPILLGLIVLSVVYMSAPTLKKIQFKDREIEIIA